MPVAITAREVVESNPAEKRAFQGIDEALHAQLRAKRGVWLIASSGHKLELPATAFEVFHRAIHLLAQGNAVAIVPYSKMLTTQQTADFLNVSRPYVVKLLKAGEIPFELVGTHRRIKFSDLLQYRSKRDEERRRKLDELTKMSEELGLYDRS